MAGPEYTNVEKPFIDQLVASTGLEPDQVDDHRARKLLEATEELVTVIQEKLAMPDFWKPSHIPNQERLKQHLFSQLMMGALARSNHARLVNA